MARTWRLRDLFLNPSTGKLSHSKLWANVACAAATYKFVIQPELSWEVWGMYLGCVGGYAAARRWMAARVEMTQIEEHAETDEERKGARDVED